ncbi:MAG: DUF433 domain-containing protein [Armatimonadetes bacterium]|nr:DUF433 domain-containing protein [Anaerolineae bacterium]
MMTIPVAIDLPLTTDADGTVRVGGTRVTLETVIADFQRGATPEQIVQHFDVLQVADVYQVIGYYLAHQAVVEAYIQQQHQEGERLRREWDAEHPPQVTKADLLARLAAKRQRDDTP